MIHYCEVKDPVTNEIEYLMLNNDEIEKYRQKGYIVTLRDDELEKGY